MIYIMYLMWSMFPQQICRRTGREKSPLSQRHSGFELPQPWVEDISRLQLIRLCRIAVFVKRDATIFEGTDSAST
jgi:hypothetical protein